MDQQAKDRITGWIRDADEALALAELHLTTVQGAFDDGATLRSIQLLAAGVSESRDTLVEVRRRAEHEMNLAIAAELEGRLKAISKALA
jgi:hypothetical protein